MLLKIIWLYEPEWEIWFGLCFGVKYSKDGLAKKTFQRFEIWKDKKNHISETDLDNPPTYFNWVQKNLRYTFFDKFYLRCTNFWFFPQTFLKCTFFDKLLIEMHGILILSHWISIFVPSLTQCSQGFFWRFILKCFQKVVFETSASFLSCEKVHAKKVNKNAPSEKKSAHCAIKRPRPVWGSKMAAFKIPTLPL